MAKHLKFEADEVIPRIKTEFQNGMKELDDLEAQIRKGLDIVEVMLNG